MTSKQRVLAAVAHATPDRVPRDLSVVAPVASRLCRLLGTESWADAALKLGLDMRHVHPRFDGPLHHSPRARTNPDGTWEDVWGVRYRTVSTASGGTHEEVVTNPLAAARTAADVERYRWPSVSCYDFSGIAGFCRGHDTFALSGGYAHFYCPGADLRGYEAWLIDLQEGSAFAHAMLAKMEEFWLRFSEQVFDAAAGMLDIFYMADDYGMQDRMLISPECWRRTFKPIVRRFLEWAHARNLPTMLHSCGSIRPIIPDLIECGLDILDPVQPLARGMDPYELKREFGGDLCLHGGLDTQRLLPRGTPAEIRDEARRLAEIVGRGGGYILAPAHQVQSDVPAENLLAVYESGTL